MKLFLSSVLSAIIGLTFVGVVSADTTTNCTPIYGGGTNCATTGLVVDKKVKHPTLNQFVDNLNTNDPKYQGDQPIAFRVTVTNTGSNELKEITMVDTLPNYLTNVTSSGAAELKNNHVTHKIGALKPGESKSFDITAAIVSEANLPNNGVTCVTNKANAFTGSIASEDTASYCIQVLTDIPTTKQGVPVKAEPTKPVTITTTKGGQPVFPTTTTTTTPKTGPEMLALIGLLPAGALGHFLRKKKK